MVKKMTIAFVFFVVMLTATPQASTCDKACKKYRSCVVSFWGKRGRKVPATQRRKLYFGCMKTCRKHKTKVLRCYKKSKNSCPVYWKCIKKKWR